MATSKSEIGEAARLERNLGEKALLMGENMLARDCFFRALDRFLPDLGSQAVDSLYVSTTLELSNLCFVLGQSFDQIRPILQAAATISRRNGDRRSEALIKLHLGRLYYFSGERNEAMKFFSKGKDMVEGLGDHDILMQSGEFLGFFFLIQGLFKEAKMYFEYATASYETQGMDRLINVSAAMWMSFCDAYMGLFPRAIGRLDYHRRLASERNDRTLSCTLSAFMGIVLIMTRRLQEAGFELNSALKEATNNNNVFALYVSRNALAHKYLLEGRATKARDMFAQSMADAADSGLVRLYTSPFVLEMAHEFHRLGLKPVPEFSFWNEVQSILRDPNIHLKGVALRLRAIETIDGNGDIDAAQADLEKSENYLIGCADPIQLGKTRVEMARLKLKQQDRTQAVVFAQRAWHDLSGHGKEFYPADLRHLLRKKILNSDKIKSNENYLSIFINIIEDLVPANDLNKLLEEATAAITEFLRAERGGLFWFRRKDKGKKPFLRASCHLAGNDVSSKNFRSNLSMVFKSFRDNKPYVVRLKNDSSQGVKAALCVPFELDGKPKGVLYFDNSYLNDCFDIFDKDMLRQMANYISKYIDQVWKYSRRLEDKALSVVENIFHREMAGNGEVLTQSPKMLKMLVQADRVAESEGTVLIMGETGVGKELLAQRLHNKSKRRDGALVVVDLSSIPENLIESELFGYEKGAFTGADRQKKGRLEIAHRGTLFLDEVGEIPKLTQVKLLRVLQNKTLVRVGGNQSITSDFRLIAATNRDLAQEVSLGRFREDLYYRINVVPLIIPPLRERQEDVPLIAQYYINKYTATYNRTPYKLTPDDKTMLINYYWRGNVRELKNVIERAVLLSEGKKLEFNLSSKIEKVVNDVINDNPTLEELQRRYIRLILNKTGGKLSGPGGATEILGMKRSSLYNRMKKLGLR